MPTAQSWKALTAFSAAVRIASFGARLLDDDRPVRGQVRLIAEIIQRNDGALEGDPGGSCLPISSSAWFAFAMAPFMTASTASGVCSQCGIVSSAFAFSRLA